MAISFLIRSISLASRRSLPDDDDMEDAGDELEAEMGMEPADEEGEDKGDMEELEDRVVDTEEAIANLQKEFEDLLAKEEGGEEEAPADEEAPEEAEESVATEEAPVEEAKAEETDEEAVEEAKDEEVTEEAKEEVEEGEEKVDESKLEKAPEADKADHADNKASPVAKGQKGGMKISKSEETGAPAPKATDMGGTTKPDVKKV